MIFDPFKILEARAEIQKYFDSFLVQTTTSLRTFWFLLTFRLGKRGSLGFWENRILTENIFMSYPKEEISRGTVDWPYMLCTANNISNRLGKFSQYKMKIAFMAI